ncbi:MAG: 3'(2'),5'-bisphosphate nucleotidase CysQ [Terracidiphilus sp.]
MIDIQNESGLSELLPHVVGLAREAGQAIMKVYSDVNPAVEYKRDNSPLTQADLASHHVIVDGLARLPGAWPVLSEESKEVPFDRRSSWRRFWMVDPLDGTKEFLRGNGEFTVNIALIEGGAPILGVVYAPAIDKLYFAARGVGAFKADRGAVSPIRAAQAQSGARRVVVSRSHGSGEENLDRFADGARNCEFIPMGSSLKFCLVAEGAADLYPRTGPTMEWDTAAAHCVLEQAGGSIADLDGEPLTYNKPHLRNPGFLAKAGFIHETGADPVLCK